MNDLSNQILLYWNKLDLMLLNGAQSTMSSEILGDRSLIFSHVLDRFNIFKSLLVKFIVPVNSILRKIVSLIQIIVSRLVKLS